MAREAVREDSAAEMTVLSRKSELPEHEDRKTPEPTPRTRCLLMIFLLGLCGGVLAEEPSETRALERSVEQLRQSIGSWNVVTDFLKEDGSVAKSVTGTYQFSWVVPDRVVAGKSEIPELEQAAGILFYVNEKKRIVEMVSVGGDGMLWIMTGPMGEEERLSQEFPTANGGTARLRFTRFNVSENAFESRMEYTEDGGKTWKPGNHQVFRRAESVGHEAVPTTNPRSSPR